MTIKYWTLRVGIWEFRNIRDAHVYSCKVQRLHLRHDRVAGRRHSGRDLKSTPCFAVCLPDPAG